ncbi:VOC family protein [Niabella aquatica]
MNVQKIVPNLWFTADGGTLANIITYYQNVFGQDFQSEEIIPLGNTPSGNTELCNVEIFGMKYVFMSTENEHHLLNDAVSFIINCKDQPEINRYWDYFTNEGKESQCGWCIDKYGLRWQVLPENLNELMSKPDSFEVMMKQRKIIIEDY